MLDWLSNFFRKYVLKNLLFKTVSLAVAVIVVVGGGARSHHRNSHDRSAGVSARARQPGDELRLSVAGARSRCAGPSVCCARSIPPKCTPSSTCRAQVPASGPSISRRNEIHVPRNVEVVQVVPAQFHISFDRSATRSVEVQPRVIGSLLSGYDITDVKADPSQIMIVGPERRVDAVENALTDPVDATGVVGKATFTTHAYVTDPLVRVQKPGPIHVTVTTGKSPEGKRRL